MNSPKPAPSIQREAVTHIASCLLAHVAHDLGTPISALRGYIKLLLDGRAGALNDQQKEFLGVAFESADRLRRLTIQLGRAPDFIEKLQAEAFDIREAWRDVIGGRAEALSNKSMTAKDEGREGRMTVVGDVEQLRHVLEVVADASISLAKAGSPVVAEFSDGTGPYIRIRVSLQAASQATNDQASDFSAVEDIVFLHGGDFSFDNQAQMGPVFAIELPKTELGHP